MLPILPLPLHHAHSSHLRPPPVLGVSPVRPQVGAVTKAQKNRWGAHTCHAQKDPNVTNRTTRAALRIGQCNWEPLTQLSRVEGAISKDDFMYMFRDYTAVASIPVTIHAYKSIAFRRYLYLDDQSNPYRFTATGYELITLDQAIAHVIS